jgi:hypothetical protein
MELNELLDDIILELSVRSKNGIPDLKSKESLEYIYEYFYEMGMPELGYTLIQNLTEEEEKQFKNPVLNKTVKYTSVNGEEKEGLVGNLLRRPKEEDAYKQAAKMLGGEESETYKKAMDDLGAEGQPTRDIDKERGDDVSYQDGQEEPDMGTAFDKNSPSGEMYLKTLPDNDVSKPDELKGDVVYPLGGGYYSDTPDGTPKYKRADERIVTESNEIQVQVAVADDAENTRPVDVVPISPDNDLARARKFDKENGKIVADFRKRAESNREFLSSEQQKILDKSLELVQDLYDDTLSDDVKRESANKLAELVKFTTNSTGEKAYFNAFGGNRKIISGKQGTKKSTDLVNKMKQYAEVRQTNFSAIKNNFSAAAKPDLGKDNEVTPKQNEEIGKLFGENEILQRINPSLHGIFTVKDENGKPKLPSSQYSKDYLKQSIENPALDRTIELAKKLAQDGSVDPKVATALESHKARLEKTLKDLPIPSEESAKAIGDSYNELMIDLHKADEDVAGSIMKQLAENRLYEESLAKGEEVYLPSKGNFPAGDMIKVSIDAEGNSDLIGVSLVSCKFGKSQRTYGCPANSKAIQSVHPDPEKRNNVGQYMGESGHTLVLKDELWRGDTDDETLEKSKEFVKKYLDEIQLGDLFNEDELDEFVNILTKYANAIDDIKSELRKTPTLMKKGNSDKYWGEFASQLSEIDKQFSQRMGSIVTPDKIEKLIGKNNVGNIRNSKGEVNPAVALCMINDSNNIRTSGGYGLSHNKQYYDDEGNPMTKTDKGTDNPDDYSITYRMNRTVGRSGGGPQYSFSGDGEKVDTVIVNGGETYDRETGEDIG